MDVGLIFFKEVIRIYAEKAAIVAAKNIITPNISVLYSGQISMKTLVTVLFVHFIKFFCSFFFLLLFVCFKFTVIFQVLFLLSWHPLKACVTLEVC